MDRAADVRTEAALERELDGARANIERLKASIGAAFVGQPQAVEEVVLALIAGGHVLIEGVPGLGKTTLARALAAALRMSFRRIQFTPDLMPGDVLGLRVLVEDAEGRRRFEFQPGPIFAHVVLADEINRAAPRTQAALLEAMQERQVTLFGERRALEDPFLVIATQNPVEMEGTYPLPEAQLDRFLFKVVLPSPGVREIEEVLRAPGSERTPPEQVVEAVLAPADVRRLRELARAIPASGDVVSLVARLVRATQPDADEAPSDVRRFVRLGASPRGGQAVLWSAQARALARGRLHVAPEDVEATCRPALRHRLALSYEGEAAGGRTDDLVAQAFARSAGR